MAVYLGDKKIAPIVKVDPSEVLATKKELERKANVDGSYETLHAGTASDLTSESGLPVEGIFRETPLPVATGDGLLTISEIRGNVAKVRNFVKMYGPQTASGINVKIEGNGFLLNGTKQDAIINLSDCYEKAINGHVYAVTWNFENAPSDAKIYCYGIEGRSHSSFILKSSRNLILTFQFEVATGTTVENLKILNPQIIDLTDIYGAGNEPKTVEAFLKDFPEYIPYEAQARLVPGTADSFNGMPLPVLSSPLLSAGNARDSMTSEGKIVRRVKVVEDMSTLPWSLYPGGNNIFLFESNDIKKRAKNESPNVLTDAYPSAPTTHVPEATMLDKTITVWPNYKGITIRDTSFSDLASFKASLKGKTLYYELETPVEEVGQPFRKALKVKAGGSVSFEGGNGYPLGLSAIAQKSIKNFAEALGNEVGWEPSKLVSQPSYAVPVAAAVSNPKIKKNEFVLRVEGNWLEIDAQITYESDGTVWTWDVLANTSFLPKDVWERLTPLKDESDAVHVGTITACSSNFANDTPKIGLFYAKKSSNVGYLGIFKPNFQLPSGSHEISLHSRIPLKEVTQ